MYPNIDPFTPVGIQIPNSASSIEESVNERNSSKLLSNIKTKLKHLETVLQPILIQIPSNQPKEAIKSYPLVNGLEDIDFHLASILDRINL